MCIYKWNKSRILWYSLVNKLYFFIIRKKICTQCPPIYTKINHLRVPFVLEQLILNIENTPGELRTDEAFSAYPDMPRGDNQALDRFKYLRKTDNAAGGWRGIRPLDR